MIWQYFSIRLSRGRCGCFRFIISRRRNLSHDRARRPDAVERRKACSIVSRQRLNCWWGSVIKYNAPITRDNVFGCGSFRVDFEEIVHWRWRRIHSRISGALSTAVPSKVLLLLLLRDIRSRSLTRNGSSSVIKSVVVFCFICVLTDGGFRLQHKGVHRKGGIIANMRKIRFKYCRGHVLGGLFFIFTAFFAHSHRTVSLDLGWNQ